MSVRKNKPDPLVEDLRYVDHALPMLRVHRSWQRAQEIARETGVDEAVALRIAQEIVGIIGRDTTRWGHMCPRCRSKIEWRTSGSCREYPICPQHGFISGGLGTGTPLALLISFDPIVYDG